MRKMRKTRKIKYATLALSALTLGIISCNKDNDLTLEKTQSVTLQISTGTPNTYAEENSQSSLSTNLDPALGGNVYFVNGTTILDHFPIVPDANAKAEEVSVAKLKSGYTFPRVSGNANTVYIVANRPNGVTLPDKGDLSGVESTPLSITSLTAIASVTLKGSAPIVSGKPSTATVTLAPVVARFEISKVEYDAAASSSVSNPIKNFDLDGIFVNNHYKKMGLDFKPINGALYSATQPADFIANNFPAPLSDLFSDKKGKTAYSPTKGVWGYQFFPASRANDLPVLVLKLSKVAATTQDPYAGEQYVSANKFIDAAAPDKYVTSFEANHIYIIESIKFSNRNLSSTPNTVLQDVIVTLRIAPWIDKKITPEL